MSQSFYDWFHITRQGLVHGHTGIRNGDLCVGFIFLLI